MKRMFGVAVALLIVYLTIQVLYSLLIGRQSHSYTIDVNNDKYTIKETFNNNFKNIGTNQTDKNNYFYEVINNNQTLFSFKIVGNYTGVSKFLTNLMIYKNNSLICGYPIFKEKVDDIDVICNKSGKMYLYGALKGTDLGLDNFVSSIKQLGYKHPTWDSINTETTRAGNSYVYSQNLTSDQNISIWSYNGFYRVNNRGNNFFSFNITNPREPSLSAMVNQYYVVPDYRDADFFKRIYLTNLISGSMDPMELGVSLSYNSFIQGVVDNMIYIIDRDSKIQYSIDIYNKKVEVTGNADGATKYYNDGKWFSKPMSEVLHFNLTFVNNVSIPTQLSTYNPLFVGSVGGKTDGYYYLYISENNGISVYQVDKQKISALTLIFTVPSISDIKYSGRDIYFISNDTLYVYRDTLGLKPLVKYSDFSTQKKNLYNVYVSD